MTQDHHVHAYKVHQDFMTNALGHRSAMASAYKGKAEPRIETMALVLLSVQLRKELAKTRELGNCVAERIRDINWQQRQVKNDLMEMELTLQDLPLGCEEEDVQNLDYVVFYEDACGDLASDCHGFQSINENTLPERASGESEDALGLRGLEPEEPSTSLQYFRGYQMASEAEIVEEMTPSLFEEVVPCEAGPWQFFLGSRSDGYDGMVGYDGVTDSEDMDTVSALDDAWFAERASEAALERRLDHAFGETLVEDRNARFENIMGWLDRAKPHQLRKAKGIFWGRVKKSRALCAETGKWWHVYLTKEQVNEVFRKFNARMGE